MKKYTLLVMAFLFLVISQNAKAQNEQNRPGRDTKRAHLYNQQNKNFDPAKMIEFRTKSLCKQLMLSDETAEQFTPLYKQYLEELQQVFPQRPAQRVNVAEGQQTVPDEMTDEEIDEQFKKRFERTAKVNTLQEQYYAKFRKILNARQVSKIFRNNSHEGVFASVAGGRQHNKMSHRSPKQGSKRSPSAES